MMHVCFITPPSTERQTVAYCFLKNRCSIDYSRRSGLSTPSMVDETTNITPEEKHYNYRQSRARMVVENAFGTLKGRWRCLLKRLDYNLCNVPVVVASCVTLHNICVYVKNLVTIV